MQYPNVRTLEGLEKIKEYYLSINSLLESGEEVMVLGARSGNSDSKDAVDFFVNYVRQRSAKGIKTKLLFNLDVQNLGKSYEQIDLVQVRYMPMGFVAKVGIDIYRDTIDMLDWSDPLNPKIIIIEDRYIAESYKEYFNLLWSGTIAIAELEKKGSYYLPEILFENYINHCDEKEKVESAVIEILNRQNPKTMLNIGAGFDSLSKSDRFPKSVEEMVIVEKNTSFVLSYTDPKIKIVHSAFELWESKEKYDVVLISHVLFYFHDKKQAIEKVLSHLKEDGIALFVVMTPSGDYKKMKDLVFGLQGKKYVYTYDKLSIALKDLNVEYQEVKIDCVMKANSNEELFKAMRLWFEMDLDNYYKYEKQVMALLSGNQANFANSIFIVRKAV